MEMTTLVCLCGVYSLAFAVFHIGFWRIFNWREELKRLSFANKAIMQIMNIQLIYYFLFVAFACFAFPKEMINTSIGKLVLGGTSLFWMIRTVQQFIFLRVNHYKIHLLTVIFLLGTILFALPVLFAN